MQIMIDLATESVAALELAGKFVLDHAALRKAMENEEQPFEPTVPASPVVPTAPPAPSNVVPFPAIPPVVSGPTPPAPVIASIIPPTLSPPAPAAAPTTFEYDSSGMPWDARIHQKGKNQKKDGTWKLQRGIADSLVESVVRELAPHVRIPSPAPVIPSFTPPTVGASAPVPLPPLPPGLENTYAAAAQAPVAYDRQQTIIPPYNLPVPAAPETPAYNPQTGYPPIPVPTAQNYPTPEPQVAPAADPFRTLVTKITAAITEKKLTPEEVTACVVGCGAPSFQLLFNMPHLIPSVDASISALLATR